MEDRSLKTKERNLLLVWRQLNYLKISSSFLCYVRLLVFISKFESHYVILSSIPHLRPTRFKICRMDLTLYHTPSQGGFNQKFSISHTKHPSDIITEGWSEVCTKTL